MKSLPVVVGLAAAGLLLALSVSTAHSARYNPEAPPVGGTLVREGDFAIALAEVLGVSRTPDEVQAESDLSDLGISPRDGWMADYPITPDIVAEVRDSVGAAADAGKLEVLREDALRKYDDLMRGLDLPIWAHEEGEAEGSRAEGGNDEAWDEAAIEDYYYNEGPPVITYYSPPWDYAYMYSWVPYPFWWGGFYCSGYYILHDFDFHHWRTPLNRRNVNRSVDKRLTNHVFDRNRNRIARVDPVNRVKNGERFGRLPASPPPRGLYNGNERRGAESILKRNVERRGISRTGESGNPRVVLNGPRRMTQQRVFNNRAGFNSRLNGRPRPFTTNNGARSFQAPSRNWQVNGGLSHSPGQSWDRGFSSSEGSAGGGGFRSFGMSGMGRGGGGFGGHPPSINRGR